MVRLHGPLLSPRAAGQLGSTLIFRRAGRAHSAYPYFKPLQPNTPPQIARRIIFQFVTTVWPDIHPLNQETWNALVPNFAPSPREAFTKYNLLRWSHFLGPTIRYQYTGFPLPCTATLTNAVPTDHGITWHFTRTGFGSPWAYVLYRSTTPNVVPTATNGSAIFQRPRVTNHTYLDTPLDPGTYYGKLSFFYQNGEWYHCPIEKSATVT